MKKLMKLLILCAVFLEGAWAPFALTMQPVSRSRENFTTVQELRIAEPELDQLYGYYEKENWHHFCLACYRLTDDKTLLGQRAQAFIEHLFNESMHPIVSYFSFRKRAESPRADDMLMNQILYFMMRVAFDALLLLHEKSTEFVRIDFEKRLKTKYALILQKISGIISKPSIQYAMETNSIDKAIDKATEYFVKMKNHRESLSSPVWFFFFEGWFSGAHYWWDGKHGFTVSPMLSSELDFWNDTTRVARIRNELFFLYGAALLKTMKQMRRLMSYNVDKNKECWEKMLAVDFFSSTLKIIEKKEFSSFDFFSLSDRETSSTKLFENTMSLIGGASIGPVEI